MDLKLILQQQMRLMEILSDRLSSSTLGQPGATSSVTSGEQAANSISEFMFDPLANITFDSWFKRYEDLFQVEFAIRDDAWKCRLLLRKLGPAEHEKYANFILPLNPRDRSFDETVRTLTQIFGEQSSLFNTRYQCMKLTKRDTDDFLTYAGIVNRESERFKLRSITDDQFKCLIFICGLQSPKDADIRTRLLSSIEQDPQLTLQSVTAECQRLINLKHDTAMIQHADHSSRSIHTVSVPEQSYPTLPIYAVHQKTPPSTCWHCGDWHFIRFCPFKQNRCQRCHQVGHKDGFCPTPAVHSKPPSPHTRASRPQPIGKSLSILTSSNIDVTSSRKFVPLLINGFPTRLQLDTASDITIISHNLWQSIGKPTVEMTPRIATSACGGSIHLSGQVSCRVTFQNVTINGKCYLSNSSLNLLGLDWIDQLGLAELTINDICYRVRSEHSQQRLADPVTVSFPSVHTDDLGVCSSTATAAPQLSLDSLPASDAIFPALQDSKAPGRLKKEITECSNFLTLLPPALPSLVSCVLPCASEESRIHDVRVLTTTEKNYGLPFQACDDQSSRGGNNQGINPNHLLEDQSSKRKMLGSNIISQKYGRLL